MATKTFNGFASLAQHFRTQLAPAIRKACEDSLPGIGKEIKREAQNQLGHYQGAIGPFSPWPQLAEATIERKGREGLGLNGDPDSPMYASGAFHDDINFSADEANLESRTGTNQKYIIAHELGAPGLPPRQVFGPAGLRAMPANLKLVREKLIKGIRSTF